tara:strand:- start:48 stop:527 length:480 start_codon:yes stop_codon:yes gene_type:complete
MIGGTGNLDGTLDLVPLAPYTDPATRGTSDEFVIIAAGTLSGKFSTVHYDGSALATDFGPDGNGSFRSHVGGGLFRNLTYTATSAQQCSAWFNVVWLQNLLALPGDTDGDMDVDLSDYNALASNFKPLGYGAAAVPEPSTALLALLGMLLISVFGWSWC